MPSQILLLQQKVHNCLGAGQRVAVVGIGQELCGDDAAGLLVAEAVSRAGLPLVRAFLGGSAPENITGEIVKFQPALTVFVDAAELKAPPGTIQEIEKAELAGVTFSTHTLPLYLIIDYLAQATTSEFLIVGIQPQSVEVDAAVCPAVREAVEVLSGMFVG